MTPDTEPRRLHNHPMDGPVIVVHSRGPGPFTEENPAHAFGPFDSEEAALAFEREGPTDHCVKTILDLVGP